MMIFNGFQKNSTFYSLVTLVTTLTDYVSNRFQKNSTFYSLVTLVTTLADDVFPMAFRKIVYYIHRCL